MEHVSYCIILRGIQCETVWYCTGLICRGTFVHGSNPKSTREVQGLVWRNQSLKDQWLEAWSFQGRTFFASNGPFGKRSEVIRKAPFGLVPDCCIVTRPPHLCRKRIPRRRACFETTQTLCRHQPHPFRLHWWSGDARKRHLKKRQAKPHSLFQFSIGFNRKPHETVGNPLPGKCVGMHSYSIKGSLPMKWRNFRVTYIQNTFMNNNMPPHSPITHHHKT